MPLSKSHHATALLSPALAALLLIFASGPTLQAANGTWTTLNGTRTWGNATNWQSGEIADGAGSTADLSTVALTAAQTVNVDGNRTIGTLKIGSTSGTFAYTLATANSKTLTFDNSGAAAQIINNAPAGVATTISVPIALATGTTLNITNNTSGPGSFSISGGVTGTGNVVVSTTTNRTISAAGSAFNNIGTITNAGTGTGEFTSAVIGSNVTGLIQASGATSTFRPGAITVNSTIGTTVTNNSNVGQFLFNGAVGGTGNLTLQNNGSYALGITNSAALNNAGYITNSGTGTGSVRLSSIGTSVQGVVQNSDTSELSLTSTSTFTSGITVKKGLVTTTVTTALGSGTVTLGDSSGSAVSGLFFNNANGVANPIVTAAGSTGSANLLVNASTISGPITLNSKDLTLVTPANAGVITGNVTGNGKLQMSGGASASLTLSGVISNGAGGGNQVAVAQNGINTLILTGTANTYTGATSANAGNLTIDYTKQIASQTSTVSNYVSSSSPLVLGGGILFINALPNGNATAGLTSTYSSGATTLTLSSISGLVVGQRVSSSAGNIPAGAYITGISGSTITLSAATTGPGAAATITPTATTATTTQSFAGTTLNAGFSRVQATNGGTAATTTLNLGAITRNIGGTVSFVPATTGTTSYTTPTANTVGSGATAILGAWAVSNNGTDWAVSAGDGTTPGNITALASNGYTTTAAGTTAPGTTANVKIGASNTTPWATQTIQSLSFNGSFTLNLASANTLTVSSGGILVPSNLSATTYAITGGNLTASSGGELVVYAMHSSARLTINSTISTATAFTKSGLGTVQLGGTNTYTGATYVNAGNLTAGVANAFGSNSAVLVSSGAALILNGYNQTIGSLATNGDVGVAGSISLPGMASYNQPVTGVGATGSVLLGANTLTVGGDNSSTSFAGIIGSTSSAGSLVKVGTGTLSLLNLNTFNGTTSINNGAISVYSVSTGTNAQGLGRGTTVNLGVAGTSSGMLIYTGIAGTLDKNINALGNGTDTVQNSGSGLLTLNGTLTKNGTKLTLNGGTSGITVSGMITGTSAGSDLVISGGTTTLTNTSNDYNGPTYVQGGGTLVNNRAGAGAALPAGTTLYIGGADNTTGTFDLGGNSQTVAGLNTQGSGGASNVVTNNGSANAALTVSGGGTFAGVIRNGSTNTTALTVTGGTLVVSGANTYTGTTTVTAGTLSTSAAERISDFSAITVASGATFLLGGSETVGSIAGAGSYSIAGVTLTAGGDNTSTTVSGNITGAGGALTKTGSGTLTLAGANTYTGTTTVTAGTLSTNAADRISDSSAITLSSGATFLLGGNETVGSIAGAGNYSIAGFRLTAGGDNSSTTVSGNITGAGGALTKTGSGTLTLAGANTYTGTTTIAEGTLALGAGASLGNAGGSDIVLGGASASAGSTATLTIAPTATVSLDAAVTYTANAGANNLGATISGGTIALNSGSRVFSVADSAAAVDLTVSSVLSNGTAASDLIKQGAGTLLLSGENTYTGVTTIQGGTLLVGGNVAASTNGALGNRADSINLGRATVTIAGENVALLTNGAFTIGRGVAVDTGFNGTTDFTSTLGGNTANTSGFSGQIFAQKDLIVSQVAGGTLNITGGITTFSSSVNRAINFAGPGAINVSGSRIENGTGGGITAVNITNGTTTFSVDNTYTGATTISGGTLQIGNGGTTGALSTSSAITNNGTLVFNRSNTITQGTDFNSVISGTGSLIQAGSGSLVLTGANTYAGSTTINAGTISFSTTGAFASTSGINLANATALLYTGGAASLDRNITVTGGTGTIRNTGAGLLTLSGSLVKNGTTLAFDTGSFNVTGIISGSSANSDLVVDGASVTLNNANTYNGPTFIVDGGTLTANVSNALPTVNGRTAVTMDATGTGNSTLALGASQSIVSLTGNTTSTVTLSSNTLTINTTSGSTTYAGRITGSNSSALVKDGSSTQVLTGNNTGFTGTTTINSGTLVAGAANAAGGTSNIVVNNGGSFLVTADDAIGTSTGIELNGGTLAFGAAGYDGYVGALTLSANSTIDLGTSSTGVLIRFSSINWSDPNALLSIYNWTGTTQWQGGTGNNLDQVYFTNTNLSSSELQRINFYSGIDSSSFVGDAFQIQGGFYDQQIIAVPEPETYLSAIALLAAFGIHILRRRATLREGHRPAWLKFLLGSGQTTPGHHPAPKPTELHLAQKV